jgi:hypothetical protein
MKKTIKKYIILILILLFSIGCHPIKTPAKENVRAKEIRKQMLLLTDYSDIGWDVGSFGLTCHLSKNAQDVIITLSENDLPFLYEYIDDNNRFVTTHVFMTKITKTIRIPDGEEWNGLRVKFTKDNKPIIDSGQISKLKEQWSKYDRVTSGNE